MKHYQNDKPCYPKGNEHINKYKMAHCIGVAEYMRERALDYGLDGDKCYVVGLLHDIGYLRGREGHEANGYDLLASMGIGGDVALAVRFHGNLSELSERTLKCDPYGNFQYLFLLVEADLSVNAQGYRVGFEGRLSDIRERYGETHPAVNTCERNLKILHEYWEDNHIRNPQYMYEPNYCFVDTKRHWTRNPFEFHMKSFPEEYSHDMEKAREWVADRLDNGFGVEDIENHLREDRYHFRRENLAVALQKMKPLLSYGRYVTVMEGSYEPHRFQDENRNLTFPLDYGTVLCTFDVESFYQDFKDILDGRTEERNEPEEEIEYE